MKRKIQKTEPQDTMRLKLDPKYYSRLPDSYFRTLNLPETEAKFWRIDIADDNMINTLDISFQQGARPRVLWIWGTKDICFYDKFGLCLKPERYHIETYRTRNSNSTKRKVLSIVSGRADSITVNPDHLFSSYEAVVAIDTNTYQKNLIGGDKLSVLGVSISRNLKLQYPRLLEITARHAIEFRNLADPKEKHGWIIALNKLFTSGLLAPERKVAVIVDSYANEVVGFNSGLEIIDGVSKPPEFSFAYASADTGTNAVNLLMKEADRFSSAVIEKLLSETQLHIWRNAQQNEPFTGIRLWQIEETADGLRLISNSRQ